MAATRRIELYPADKSNEFDTVRLLMEAAASPNGGPAGLADPQQALSQMVTAVRGLWRGRKHR